MTAQQYSDQNALGFEGDTFLKAHIEDLVKKHNVKAIIETGTYLGATTLQFVKMVDNVYTVEANKKYFDSLASKFTPDSVPEKSNITSIFGDTVDALPDMISGAVRHGGVLIFEDAHWGNNNPLLQELKIIAESGIRPVIIIHDFKVPNHPELGFDSYGGQDYEWSWIENSINEIYGKDGYTYFYNSEATGAKRGVIFIEPK